MRGRHSTNHSHNHHTTQDTFEEELSAQNDSFSAINPHDQAFIVYSDEDILSRSSHSYASDSRSVSFSQSSHQSHMSKQSRSVQENINILDQIGNEESSIYDVRQSECSESGKELLQQLEPLFQNKNFVRRSPRFVNHNQPLYTEAIQIVEKPFRVKKVSAPLQLLQCQMIEDEKSPIHQNTQILEEKEEPHMQFDNTTCNSSVIIPSLAKLGELSDQPQIFPSLRQTRSSLRMNFEQEITKINERREMGRKSTSEYLSKATKEFIMSVKKDKKIKKRTKEKSLGSKVRQYNLRHH